MKGKEAVVVQNLRKEFVSNHKRKVAVDGLSVTLYNDQITALLGHNGAGIRFHPFHLFSLLSSLFSLLSSLVP
jgi:ABC-type uncharacterized transport system ATPase subunit